MIIKITYWTLISPLVIIGAFTSSMVWIDRKLRDSETIERYFLWCEKVSKINR